MNDKDIEWWFEYKQKHPRRWRLESELPVQELPVPVSISPEESECMQECIDDENWSCLNRAVWQIGFVCVCNDCFERVWKPQY